jgi:hypothetical protein
MSSPKPMEEGLVMAAENRARQQAMIDRQRKDAGSGFSAIAMLLGIGGLGQVAVFWLSGLRPSITMDRRTFVRPVLQHMHAAMLQLMDFRQPV